MNKIYFLLTVEHIKLARQMNVRWAYADGIGAPKIDPIRPYGNTNIATDIAEIIDLDFTNTSDGRLLNVQQENRCFRLHKEMGTALQIILSTGKFKSGKYEKIDYEWVLVK